VTQMNWTVYMQWIYALGAVLEKPVHADVSATLRALMRRIASLRAGPLEVRIYLVVQVFCIAAC
jgi:hypothetical protein